MGNVPMQMGLQTHKQSYQHGETMRGTVYISVSSVNATIQSFHGIRLQFAGYETTEIQIEVKTGENTTYQTRRESSCILRVEVPLTTFTSPLRVAKYEFPFEWKLPDDEQPLPSSFRHGCRNGNGHCELRYTLSAYLVPEQQQQGGSLMGCSFLNNTSNQYAAVQTIDFLGAPARSIPEPLNLAEERTPINEFCCCWKQGYVSLGWEADTIVLTPRGSCHLLLWGSNSSSIRVHHLRVQLVQSIHWQAGGSDHPNTRHTKNHTTTLIDYNVDVCHLPQWDPLIKNSKSTRGQDYQAATWEVNDTGDPTRQQQPVATSFQVPPDAMDSYQGINCSVVHTLTVSAVTRFMATTPTVSYHVHLQRMGIENTESAAASLPVATAWMEQQQQQQQQQHEYQDVVLPDDWIPDEKVPVIHLSEIACVVDHPSNNSSSNAIEMATAQAVAVVDTPFNPSTTAVTSNDDDNDPLAFARRPPSDDSDLEQFHSLLKEMIDPNDTHRRVEREIRHTPLCQRVLATLTPDQYQYLCQAGTPDTICRIAVLLATELNKGAAGFQGEFLVALMQLPVAQDTSIRLIGSLTELISDLEESAEYVQQSLRPDDAQWFRQRVDAVVANRQQQQQHPHSTLEIM